MVLRYRLCYKQEIINTNNEIMRNTTRDSRKFYSMLSGQPKNKALPDVMHLEGRTVKGMDSIAAEMSFLFQQSLNDGSAAIERDEVFDLFSAN